MQRQKQQEKKRKQLKLKSQSYFAFLEDELFYDFNKTQLKSAWFV